MWEQKKEGWVTPPPAHLCGSGIMTFAGRLCWGKMCVLVLVKSQVAANTAEGSRWYLNLRASSRKKGEGRRACTAPEWSVFRLWQRAHVKTRAELTPHCLGVLMFPRNKVFYVPGFGEMTRELSGKGGAHTRKESSRWATAGKCRKFSQEQGPRFCHTWTCLTRTKWSNTRFRVARERAMKKWGHWRRQMR